MVPNAALLKAIRSQGFEFKRQGPRVNIWKKPGSTVRLTVPRRSAHEPLAAVRLLQQAGMDQADIDKIVAGE